MSLTVFVTPEKSRLRALLDHFAEIEDPREPWRVAHPLPEVLLLAVCGTIADCDDYEGMSSDTSPSISCALPTTSKASGSGENAPAGTPSTSPLSSDTYRVNLDSEPCK